VAYFLGHLVHVANALGKPCDRRCMQPIDD